MPPPRDFTLVRHGQTDYNSLHLLNGDPAVPVSLDETGRGQVEALRAQLADRGFDLAVHTRFRRTVQTLDLLLAGRDVRRVECADLDDVGLGVFEGASADVYRTWRRAHPQDTRPDGGGESRMDALVRYVRGFRRLLACAAAAPLVVTHDIPIRFVANALAGDDPLDGRVTAVANASVLVVTEPDLVRAVTAMEGRVS